MMAKTRAEQDTKEPFSYRARFDENGQPLDPVVIYSYHTGLPISEPKADKLTLPEPSKTSSDESGPGGSETRGESIDDPPTPADNPPGIITIELDDPPPGPPTDDQCVITVEVDDLPTASKTSSGESEPGDSEIIVVEVLPRAGQEHSPTNPPTNHADIITVEVG
jgi:hypothetical protein